MPQMKPLNWMFLYLAFMMFIYLFTMINYFNKSSNMNQSSINNNLSMKILWKW